MTEGSQHKTDAPLPGRSSSYDTVPLEPDLGEIKTTITAGDFSAAKQQAEWLLAEHPNHAELLYMHAVACRYLEDLETALTSLRALKTLSPEHARAYQEEGHILRRQSRDEEALQAYARACLLNPALQASFQARVELLTRCGRPDQANAVKAQLTALGALPKPLVAVIDLISQGKLLRAEEICRAFLQKVPHHPEAMRLLADIGVRFGVLDDAEFLLESAAGFAPDNNRIAIDYIQVLRRKQKYEAALSEAERLLAKAPDNPQYRSIVAVEKMQSGYFEEALEDFEQVLQQLPKDPVTLTSRGHALKTSGQFDDAVESYHRAANVLPSHGEAWYSLANLKTYTFTDAEVSTMQAQLAGDQLFYMDRVYLSFALGKAHEDKSEPDAAFEFYRTGNSLKKAQSRYDAARMTEELQSQIEICNASMFDHFDNAGCQAKDPIFILGLPRSGSTLLEQILSSHSLVDGTHELPNILTLSQQLRRQQTEYPEGLSELTSDQLTRFGETYIAETRIHRGDAPYFIDKMPNNFRHIGLIRLILPNAKIIDARRHPMACCFSGYKQLFAEGQEFSYDLSDLGTYYRDYVSVMDHYDGVLPGYILRVEHEELVADLDGEVRRILDFLSLDFEESCVRYHETERLVRTPSSEQVRQPIFTTALEQWRQFEPHLSPLVSALGPDIRERYPFEFEGKHDR